MSRPPATLLWIALATACAGVAVAQSSGGDFATTRQVIAGGGNAASGAGFTVVTTAGQPSVELAAGGPFVVRGGFHVPAELTDTLFSDSFEGATP